MKKTICLCLALLMVLGMTACGNKEGQIDPVLAQRRDAAESYMRSMLSVLWSPEEDLLYTFANKSNPKDAPKEKQIHLKADRVYQGIPYSYAGSTLASFMEYAGEPDSSGIHTVRNLPWKALNGSSKVARIGNDGSSSVYLAWAQIGKSFNLVSTGEMVHERGYLHVGQYESPVDSNKGSDQICRDNGQQTMFAAYAQLQKADALVASLDSGGHAMMAVTINTVYSKNGEIDGQASTVTVLEQSKEYVLDEISRYDEQLKKDVYLISGLDLEYTFQQLFEGGYLPITCKELIDPAPLTEVQITDSNANCTADVFANGFIDCSYPIDTVTITVTDKNGQVVQQAALRAVRGQNRNVGLNRFAKDAPEGIRGSYNYESLPSGTYRCTLVCRLVNGQEFTTRDITFDKES